MLLGVGLARIDAEVFDLWLGLASVQTVVGVVELECGDEGGGGEEGKYDAGGETHGGYGAGAVRKIDEKADKS